MDSKLLTEVRAWIADDPDPVTAAQLAALIESGDEITLRKYFSGFLQFGTAGLRGPLGPGPSCMNQAVVGRTAAGIVPTVVGRTRADSGNALSATANATERSGRP